MAVKPDFALVQTQSHAIMRAVDAAKAVVTSKERVVENLKSAAYVLYMRSLNKELENISVDRMVFATHDVPLDALKQAGYTNALQIRNATVSELKQVPGMEPKSLSKLFDAIKETRKVAEKRATIRLSMDHPDSEQTQLVTALYRYISLYPIYSECEMMQQSFRSIIENSIPSATKINTQTRWFFASKTEKEEVAAAAKEVEEASASPMIRQATAAQTYYYNVMGLTADAIWKDYASRPQQYYAELEKFLDDVAEEARIQGRSVQIPRPAATSEMLPTEIADQVEEFALDTTELKATLRNYQNFGTKYMLSQQRVLLGDEMGLGKTVQAIGAMSHLHAEGGRHFLVVAPASVLVNWTREVAKFSEIQAYLLHGLDFADNLIAWYNKGGVAVTNFESVGKILAAKLTDLHLDMVVVDEAHFVKNPEARRTQNVKQMADQADYAVFMTGTPLENNVTEMRNLIRMLRGSLGNKLSDKADTFEKQACSVYLRRTRLDVLKELPEKTETEEWCKLGAAEKKAYRKQVMGANFMGMRQVSWDVSDIEESSKAARMKEIVEEAVKDGRKVLVFSYFLGTLGKVKEMFGDAAAGPIDGSVSMERRQEIIDEFSASETQNVLVCQAISGGTGLNIQSASVVIFCEPQIKPSIETQAIARSYRMGQAHDVLVYRLLAENTVDERIMEILSDKQEIFDAYAERSLVGSENLKRISSVEEAEKANFQAETKEKDASLHQEEILRQEMERIQAEEAADAPVEDTETAAEENVSEVAEESTIQADAQAQADAKAQTDAQEQAQDSEIKEKAKKTRKSATPRRNKQQLIKDRYPDGELIPGGVYGVGETEEVMNTLRPGRYFIRVQDSRERAAEVKVYASKEDQANGKVKTEYTVDEAELITLLDGEIVTMERADLVKARE